MGATNNPEGDSQAGKNTKRVQTGDHTTALHADAYTAPLNHRVMNPNGTIETHPPLTKGPKLTDLTIDTTPGHVVVHDVPKLGDSYKERQAALHRTMPISNEHFRELVKGGTDFMAMNDGGFNIQMRNALNEANQSDRSMGTGHQHVDDLLKYANEHLNDTFYTLRRKGNTVEIWDTHDNEKHPVARWNLNKNAYEK